MNALGESKCTAIDVIHNCVEKKRCLTGGPFLQHYCEGVLTSLH